MSIRLIGAIVGVALAGLVGLASVAVASDEQSCQLTGTCTVDGAEVDDDGTIAARAKGGIGPGEGFVSDARIQTDATVVGTLPNGVKIYSYKFIWEDDVRVGLVAQDLLDRADTREAVVILANGLLGIDYKRLGLRMATEAEWRADGVAALQADYAKATPVEGARAPVILYNKKPGG